MTHKKITKYTCIYIYIYMAAEVASYSGFHYKFVEKKKEKKMMIRRNRHTTFASILVMSCTFSAQHRENIQT